MQAFANYALPGLVFNLARSPQVTYLTAPATVNTRGTTGPKNIATVEAVFKVHALGAASNHYSTFGGSRNEQERTPVKTA